MFAHDVEAGLAAAAALVNTIDAEGEGLPDVTALDEFAQSWGWTGARQRNAAELQAVRELRSRLRKLWDADEAQTVEIVNALLRETKAVPQLVKHDGWHYHVHATHPNAGLAARMAVEAAMAFVDLVRYNELARLQVCSYPGCGNVMVDLTKNRSRKFCDNGCGNRAAAAAYRARRALT